MRAKMVVAGTLTVIAYCGLALRPASATAQRISEQRTVSPARVFVEAPTRVRENTLPLLRADSGGKSAFVAGMLSFLLPGAGSFYAGNSVHGWTHMLIEVGTFGAGLAVGRTCNGELGCGVGVLTGVGAVLIGNQIWSIVTAVKDASSTHNRAHDH